MKPESIEKALILATVTLLINPVILFMVLGNFILSLLIFACAAAMTMTAFSKSAVRPLLPLILSALTTLSILIHGEAIFTFSFSEYIIEDLYEPRGKYYFNRPNLDKQFQDKEYRTRYLTNNQGFRIGHEDNKESSISQVDWLFIGDSFTQGAQVEFEDLYTQQLYHLFPSKIILNAGISGWGLPEEYNYYVQEGHKLGAKLVILQLCNFNDFMNVREREMGFSDYLMSKSNLARFLLYPFKYANPEELPLGRWTEPFYSDADANLNYNIFYKQKSDMQLGDIAAFESYLKLFNEAVQSNGARLVVLQIPTKEQVYFRYLDEVLRGFEIPIEDLDMDYPNRLLAGICRTNSILHLDLFNEFRYLGNGIFYDYDEHLSRFGHDQVARVTADFLRANGFNSFSEMLSSHNSEDRYPAFFDYNQMTFQSMRDSNLELFISDSLLNEPTRLTYNNIDELHPCANLLSGQIVFTEGDQKSGKTKVGIMNFDGSNRRYLTSDGLFGAIPAWSPDGQNVACSEWTILAGQHTNPYIAVYHLKTGVKRVITLDSVESWRPMFSVNGQQLFFISKPESNFDIYQFDFASNQTRRLTDTMFDEWDPSPSPDGKSLIFAGRQENNWDLFIMDLGTQRVKRLFATLGDEWDPAFSPDGKYVYFGGAYGLVSGIYRCKLN
jgi:Tol biopolymer transport system component